MKSKFILFCILLCIANSHSYAQILDKSFYTTNGSVNTIVKNGDTLYIGGVFSAIGRKIGGLTKFETGTDNPDLDYPQLEGLINAMEPDGNNGFYIAGNLQKYKGLSINSSVIHIAADGTLDHVFAEVHTNDIVLCAKKKNNRLYIGGAFTTVQGLAFPYICALDPVTGAVMTSWVPSAPAGYFVDKVDATDSVVFIRGEFESLENREIPSEFAVLSSITGKMLPSFPVPNRLVHTFTVDADTLYLGGDFNQVGQPRNNLVRLNKTDLTINTAFPEPSDKLNDILSDGAGGYFIAGTFAEINTQARTGLAHVLADGSLDPAFNLIIKENGSEGTVTSLATDGVNLYVGGNFSTVNGTARLYAFAVKMSTGQLLSWNPAANGVVRTITRINNTLYLGGDFTTIQDSVRIFAAAVTTANKLTSWNPNPDGQVLKLLPANDSGSIFLCGGFHNLGNLPRSFVAQTDTRDGTPTAWSPTLNNGVNTMALKDTSIYLGGYFTTINGQPRNYFGEISLSSGQPTAFRADCDSYVWVITPIDNNLYLGGLFHTIRGVQRSGAASINMLTDSVNPWNPNTGYINCIYNAPASIFISGQFSTFYNENRTNFAGIYVHTNKATAWNPVITWDYFSKIDKIFPYGNDIFIGGRFNYDDPFTGKGVYTLMSLNRSSGLISRSFSAYPGLGSVTQMTVSNGKLYIGGAFLQFFHIADLSYTTQNHLAAYDLQTSSLLPMVYNPNGNVKGLFTDNNDNLVACGDFTLVSALPRYNIASFNLKTRMPTDWSPNVSRDVNAIAIKDTTAYIGGAFTFINNDLRTYAGAISTRTGNATAWRGDATTAVFSLAIVDSTLYMGGAFTRINNITRKFAAAISTTEPGTLTNWIPSINKTVLTVVPYNGDIYLGGSFTTVGNLAHPYLAKVNNTTGAVNAWNPNLDAPAVTIVPYDKNVYAVGTFTAASGLARNGVAAFDLVTNAISTFDPKLKTKGNNTHPNVKSIGFIKNTAFIGCQYVDSIQGIPRGRLAAVDTTTSYPTAFNALPDNAVLSLVTTPSHLFAGGDWTKIALPDSSTYSAYFAAFTVEPAISSSSLIFTGLQPQGVTAQWTNGAGEYRMVTAKQGGSTTLPQDGKAYTANAAFGNGSTTGNNSYTVYSGADNIAPVTNLLPNHSYTFSVVDYNGLGSGADYLQSAVVTGSITTPCPAYTLTLDSSGLLDICPGKTVDLIAPGYFSGYQWSNGAATSTITINTPGTYNVVVTDSNNCHATSNTVVVSLQTCAPPANVSTTNITSTRGKANWSPVDCAVKYKLQGRPQDAVSWQTFTLPSTATSYTATGLTPAKTYQWRIASVCQNSPLIVSAYSSIQSFTTAGSLISGTQQSQLNQGSGKLTAVLYPNPVIHTAYLQVNRISDDLKIELTDLSGKSLWLSGAITATTITIPVDKLASGTYIVIVKDKENNKIVKLVKQ